MEETVNQEVKEMPEAEMKAPVVQRPFKLKEDCRITLENQELNFLIGIGQAFMPFLQFSKGISEVAAFGEYLKSKLLETKQVEFLDTPGTPESSIITDIREPDNSEAEVQAEQELSKMRVVHNAKKDIQEELANQ